MVEVLRGGNSEKVIKAHLDRTKEYGMLNAFSREDLTFIIEWLIKEGFILKTKGQYPVLHPTYMGTHYDAVITKGKIKALQRKLEQTENGGI